MDFDTQAGEAQIVAAARAVSCDIGEEVMILNSDTGVYYSLDGTGLRIWKAIKTPGTIAEICDLLRAEYEVEADQCEVEVRDLIAYLTKHGLVELRVCKP